MLLVVRLVDGLKRNTCTKDTKTYLTFGRGGFENVVVLLKASVDVSVDGVGLRTEGRILSVVQNVVLSVENVTVTCHF